MKKEKEMYNMVFTKEQEKFIKEYSNQLKNGCASVFIGSGLSRESGYVGWSELLKKYARKLKLNIKKEESDLISLAQYYVNSKQDSNELKKYSVKFLPLMIVNVLTISIDYYLLCLFQVIGLQIMILLLNNH